MIFLYKAISYLRYKLYQKNILKSGKLDIPVISIGNIHFGGTGKTQASILLGNFLTQKKFKPAIILRGYKRKSKGTLVVSDGKNLFLNERLVGDEAYLLGKLTKAIVIVSENRFLGAVKAKELGANIIILDDGFSNFSLKKDLEIVLLPINRQKDSFTREFFYALKRADIFLLTRCESFKCKLEIKLPEKPTFKTFNTFESFVDKNFNSVDSSLFKKRDVVVFSALGDNKQFFKFVQNLSKIYEFNIIKELPFKDHFDYKNQEFQDNYLYLTTLKDLVKLKDKNINVFGIKTKLEIEDSFFTLFESVLQKLY